MALPLSALGIANSRERVINPALIAFAMAVYIVPKSPRVPKVAPTAAMIGAYGLLPVGLIPASAVYRERHKTFRPEPKEIQRAISGRYLFGHRFMQCDSKMKMVKHSWDTATMPASPLAFDTALISAKRR